MLSNLFKIIKSFAFMQRQKLYLCCSGRSLSKLWVFVNPFQSEVSEWNTCFYWKVTCDGQVACPVGLQDLHGVTMAVLPQT